MLSETYMDKNEIKEIALNNGFKLKDQPDGTVDLNPYVYDFAQALLGNQWKPIELAPKEDKFVLAYGVFEYEWSKDSHGFAFIKWYTNVRGESYWVTNGTDHGRDFYRFIPVKFHQFQCPQ